MASASPPATSSARARAQPSVQLPDNTRRGGWILVLVGVVFLLIAITLVL